MKFSYFFINRPIFAGVLSVLIVIVGIISYYQLPVSQYPEIAPPTIQVSATYPGASPEVIARTVASPLEQEINGVENMLYMSSQSTNDGTLTITVTFEVGTDLDNAQVLVQNRVAVAEPRLPEQVRRLGVTTQKSSPNLMMVVHLLSPDDSYDQLYISNYASLQVKDVLARIDGVGNARIFGGSEYSMRVWLDPEKLSYLNLTTIDVVNALQSQNVQVAAGVIGQPPAPEGNPFQLSVNTQGRLAGEEEFGNIVVKRGENGKITRLRDVAEIVLGAQDYSLNSYLDGEAAIGLGIFQRPGTNAISTAQEIRDTMKDLSADFPAGLEYKIIYDPTKFVEESLNEVLTTLFEAFVLVLIVILVFLQNWRATMIPIFAIPVSIIGTFAIMSGIGFSLNTLSLFGLILAIGIVVDDAIIVVENVERNMENGLSAKEATRLSMDEVGSAIIASVVVLIAVFLPTAFIGGITGQFYEQFAITIAVSTAISAFNSLTLSPALCALFFRHKEEEKDRFARLLDLIFGWFFRFFNRYFEKGTQLYTSIVSRITRRSGISLLVYIVLIAFTVFMFRSVPTGFIPEQDQGYLIVSIQLPDGASLERTDDVTKSAERIIADVPGIEHSVSLAGFSGATFSNSSNAGAIFTILEPFEARSDKGLSADRILQDLQGRLMQIQEAFIIVIKPPSVRGLGTSGGFKMQVQDKRGSRYKELQQIAGNLTGAANQEPELSSVFSTFRANTPQLFVDIDRIKASKLDIPLDNIFATLQVYLGSFYVNDFNLFGRTYQVRAQAKAPHRLRPEDIMELRTRNADGEMVPLGSVADVGYVTGPDRVVRYNLYPSADIQGEPATGYSSGDALSKMEQLAGNILPAGYSYEWTEIAFQQKKAGNTAFLIFPLAVLFVFLILAAQYESLSLPLAVILIVPMCILFAITGVWLRGMDNNILTQISFIVLVGLAAKNAILIIEFAKQKQESGMDRFEAAIEACRLRLRPILMTSFAFIMGVIPLVVATGPGSEMRQAMGTAVFSGMIGVTFFGLLLTPIFYVVIQWVVEKKWRTESSDSGNGTSTSIIIIPLLIGTLGLTSCMVGPDYKIPETETAESFANSGSERFSEKDTEVRWWKGFKDEKLFELIDRSLKNNLDIRIATARLREARSIRSGTTFELFPIGDANASYTRERVSEKTTLGSLQSREFDLYQAGFDASWELDFFGRVRRSLEADSAEVGAAIATRRDVIVSLISEVARNYMELRGTQYQLKVARQNAENQEETLELTIALLEGGRGTELDTASARAQLKSTQALIPPLEAQIKRIIHRLGVLLGEQPAALYSELLESGPIPDLPEIVPVGNPGELLRRRPDIRVAERRLAAATARIGVAVADLFPRVSLFGGFGFAAESFSDLGSSGTDTFSVGPSISWGILDLGRIKSRIDASDARAEAALAEYELAVLSALEDTENALVDFQKELERRNNLRESEESARKAVELSQMRYRYGVTDFLTVLDAERRLLQIQEQLAASETRTATSLIAVYKALGGGWEIENTIDFSSFYQEPRPHKK